MQRNLFVSTVSVAISACILVCCTKNSSVAPEASPSVLGSDRILFTYKAPGQNSEIYSSTTGGLNPLKLTTDPSYDAWWPRPSPDRKKILYYRAPVGSNEDYGQADLMLMNADGSQPSVLIPRGANAWTIQAHAEWSPTGRELVMCGTQGGVIHVFVTDVGGTISRQLTTNGGWNCDPSWAPDAQKIIFNRCVGTNCHAAYGNLDIYEMSSTDGSGLTPLTSPDGHEDYDPYYSPDGTRVAWLHQANNTAWSGLGAWSIKKMAADGSSQTFLINDGNINSKPAWSNDGSKIYFHRFVPLEAAKWRLFYFSSGGSGLSEVSPFGSATNSSVGDISYPSF